MGAKILLSIGLLFYIVTDLEKCSASHAALQGSIELVGMRLDGNPNFTPPPFVYPITAEDQNFSIRFEANACGGQMKLKSGQQIELLNLACTQASGDSPYAESVQTILSSLHSYSEINDKEIILTGSAGSVWLKSID